MYWISDRGKVACMGKYDIIWTPPSNYLPDVSLSSISLTHAMGYSTDNPHYWNVLLCGVPFTPSAHRPLICPGFSVIWPIVAVDVKSHCPRPPAALASPSGWLLRGIDVIGKTGKGNVARVPFLFLDRYNKPYLPHLMIGWVSHFCRAGEFTFSNTDTFIEHSSLRPEVISIGLIGGYHYSRHPSLHKWY